MTKRFTAIALSLLMVIALLAGCGSNSNDEKVSADKPTNEQSEQVTTSGQTENETEEGKDTVDKVGEASNGSSSSEMEILSTGPHGEKATPASTIKLTDEEIEEIKAGNYTAAIVLHYAGNDWSTAQVKGLKDTFKKFGIHVLTVTDAQFKAEKQVSDIENVLTLDPDIIVSIPVDPVSTAPAYRKTVEKGVKLVFMDNCPDGFEAGKDYVSVVSADNYGNGVAAANIMAKELGNEGKIGVVYFDANFFVTNQRVEAFEKTIKEKYPKIEIVERGGFNDPNKASAVADAMLTKYPDLDGIFAVWDVPAEGVVAAAKAAGRDDLVITTIDLGENAARIIAEGGLIKGLGAQLPYDQGVTEAKLAACALLGKETPPYVAVPALLVTRDNILEAYRKVYHKDPPEILVKALESGE